ncbi:hypothetical protein BpHYR1_052984 [Brachionus plicatilis]|uniref:Uncharacterized protein n=1 Tax=Brachionus plicatilis TaxID=10195 RepID=A0A3M7PMY8_BRAPC|nr:hypothetical protein BpHYR1_052984 [Brachionus plicatilis]
MNKIVDTRMILKLDKNSSFLIKNKVRLKNIDKNYEQIIFYSNINQRSDIFSLFYNTRFRITSYMSNLNNIFICKIKI